MGYDLNIYLDAARAVLAGLSPYTAPGFFSPPALAYLLAPLAVLPPWLAFGLWTIVNLIALVLLARRRLHLALLFLPVWFHLYVGQVDMLILALGLLGGWPGLALATLKPQWAVFLFLFYRHDRRRLIYATLAAAVLHAPTLPLWPEWLSSTPSFVKYAGHASSLFGIASLSPFPILLLVMVAAMGIVTFTTRPDYWRWVATFNPMAHLYSLTVLVPSLQWRAVVVSWLALPLALYLNTGLPFVLVPLLSKPNDSRDAYAPISRRWQALTRWAGRIIPGIGVG